MTYFLQGLRPDIRQLVYMKEPKTFAEAEKAARFAESVARVPQSATRTNPSEQDVLVKLLNQLGANSWFSHDVSKIQTTKLLIFLRFYLNDVQEQLKTNIHTNFRSEWVLGFVIHYA